MLRAPWDSLGLTLLVAWLAFLAPPLGSPWDPGPPRRSFIGPARPGRGCRRAAARAGRAAHDGPLQDLLLLTRRLELAGDPAAAAAVRSVADELREVCGELRVPILDDLGAGPALEWLVARVDRLTGDQIVLERLDQARPPAGVELAVFRIAQEALANAARHGRPPTTSGTRPRSIRAVLAVDDAGPGIEPDAARQALRERRFGLQAMSQRAEQIGARLSVAPRESGGTRGSAWCGRRRTVTRSTLWPGGDRRRPGAIDLGVAVVDDHPAMREGSAALLAREPDLEVVATGARRQPWRTEVCPQTPRPT